MDAISSAGLNTLTISIAMAFIIPLLGCAISIAKMFGIRYLVRKGLRFLFGKKTPQVRDTQRDKEMLQNIYIKLAMTNADVSVLTQEEMQLLQDYDII